MANSNKKPRKGAKPKPEKAKKTSASAPDVTETPKPEPCRALVLYRRLGRPTSFTPELALTICCQIAEGRSLRTICEDETMPSKSTVLRWVVLGKTAAAGSVLKQFWDQYAGAREIQAHLLADEIIEIADTPQAGIKTEISEKGIKTIEGDMIEHRRLRVDTRKWFLSKVLPKLFGDKVAHEVSAPGGGPIQIQPVPKFNTAQEFASWVQQQQKLQSAGP